MYLKVTFKCVKKVKMPGINNDGKKKQKSAEQNVEKRLNYGKILRSLREMESFNL